MGDYANLGWESWSIGLDGEREREREKRGEGEECAVNNNEWWEWSRTIGPLCAPLYTPHTHTEKRRERGFFPELLPSPFPSTSPFIFHRQPPSSLSTLLIIG